MREDPQVCAASFPYLITLTEKKNLNPNVTAGNTAGKKGFNAI